MQTNFGMPRRTAAGTDYNRVNLLMAVLEKRLGFHMGEFDAYVNVAGGIKINEPALDLVSLWRLFPVTGTFRLMKKPLCLEKSDCQEKSGL